MAILQTLTPFSSEESSSCEILFSLPATDFSHNIFRVAVKATILNPRHSLSVLSVGPSRTGSDGSIRLFRLKVNTDFVLDLLRLDCASQIGT